MKFYKYLKKESKSLKSFVKMKKKEYEDYMKIHNDPNSRFNKSLEKSKQNEPQWTKLEGNNILKVKGSKIAALPVTGKKNSAKFIIFNINTRKEITYLKKSEVYSWLTRVAKG